MKPRATSGTRHPDLCQMYADGPSTQQQQKQPQPPTPTEKEKDQTPPKQNQRHGGKRDFRCHRCGQQGHTLKFCPQKVNLATAWGHQTTLSTSCMVDGQVGQKNINNILVDKGAQVSCVDKNLVPDDTPSTGTTTVAGAIGDTHTWQLYRGHSINSQHGK